MTHSRFLTTFNLLTHSDLLVCRLGDNRLDLTDERFMAGNVTDLCFEHRLLVH